MGGVQPGRSQRRVPGTQAEGEAQTLSVERSVVSVLCDKKESTKIGYSGHQILWRI